jgi:hypothetical protein
MSRGIAIAFAPWELIGAIALHASRPSDAAALLVAAVISILYFADQ